MVETTDSRQGQHLTRSTRTRLNRARKYSSAGWTAAKSASFKVAWQHAFACAAASGVAEGITCGFKRLPGPTVCPDRTAYAACSERKNYRCYQESSGSSARAPALVHNPAV